MPEIHMGEHVGEYLPVPMLDSYIKNRFNITLSCRQIGKCLVFNELDTKKDGNVSHKYIEDIYLERKKDFLSKLKSILFKIYRKL